MTKQTTPTLESQIEKILSDIRCTHDVQLYGDDVSDASSKIAALIQSAFAGQVLYNDLAKRVISRIIAANPEQKDIELAACEIIRERDQLWEERERLKQEAAKFESILNACLTDLQSATQNSAVKSEQIVSLQASLDWQTRQHDSLYSLYTAILLRWQWANAEPGEFHQICLNAYDEKREGRIEEAVREWHKGKS